MKISKTKFVVLFVIGAAVFMISSTLLLGQPAESLFGTGSFAGILLSPVKMILMGPLLPFIHFLRQDPDTPPPFFLAGFVFYWALLALSIHYLISKFKVRHA
jgi:hypothetical protein